MKFTCKLLGILFVFVFKRKKFSHLVIAQFLGAVAHQFVHDRHLGEEAGVVQR